MTKLPTSPFSPHTPVSATEAGKTSPLARRAHNSPCQVSPRRAQSQASATVLGSLISPAMNLDLCATTCSTANPVMREKAGLMAVIRSSESVTMIASPTFS